MQATSHSKSIFDHLNEVKQLTFFSFSQRIAGRP